MISKAEASIDNVTSLNMSMLINLTCTPQGCQKCHNVEKWDSKQRKGRRAIEISTVNDTCIPESRQQCPKQRKHQYANIELVTHTLPVICRLGSDSSWRNQTVQDSAWKCNPVWTQRWCLIFQLLSASDKSHYQVACQLWCKVTSTY